MCSADIFLGLLALLFPPLPVWVKRGICSADSIINILLCLLGYIPGLIHAWYIIAKFPEPDYEYESVPQQDHEGGRVTYVFVHGNGNGHGPHTQQPQQQPRPTQNNGKGGNNVSYGTTINPNNSGNAAAGGSSRPQQPQPYQDQTAGEGSSDGAVPPSYADVVAGDNKIQTRD
ncbi:Plasma membrane proteolipid 3 [Colletotrichum shisoi]|uniref:Plasma membrane proteolipid 3 n=1 Tax=Colletotrichum shisoi TaxID=2078593 RepID=A0A5Q4BTL1_9PEZI|nr:Plasma membrane proteolipid 3 [Colletotrichum shisoi]